MRPPQTNAEKHASRDHQRAEGTVFVGIDGEGVTDPATGEHSYVLLSCGEHHLSIDGLHLDFLDICEFLLGCWRPERAYVGFFLSYDFGQWFRTLPVYEAYSLFHPEGGTFQGIEVAPRRRHKYPEAGPYPVRYEDFEFDYLPGKRFRLRPRTPRGAKGAPYMNICDAGSFFQTSFLKAIDPARTLDPVVTAQEYELIKIGKDRRNIAEFDPKMVEYNQLECAVLARLMRQHDQGIRSLGLKLDKSQWFGPGQVAAKWLRSAGAPKGETVREATPEPVRDAARASYYGGWFELFWHGPRPGRSYAYDINSAYPFVMSRLPCLLHGAWKREEERGGQGRILAIERLAQLGQLGFALVRATLKGKGPRVGAMLHRTKRKHIVRPWNTAGWFWASELAAAYDAGFINEVRLIEVWRFEQHCDCAPPLAGLKELYEHRLAVGKNTIPGKAAKLTYNSAYGKLAQSIGLPAWSNPVYASAITSGCREMVTRAIASHPKFARDLLMVATDGLVFGSPHPGLDLDPERLGAWTASTHENLCLWQPGIYWDDEARARIAQGDQPAFKSRGFPAKDFARHLKNADEAWSRMNRDGWPRLYLPISFQLVSPKQALDRNDWSLCGKPVPWPRRYIKSDPSEKRSATGPGFSQPYDFGDAGRDLWSLPYDGLFGDELRDKVAEEYGDHPDGDVQILRGEVFYDR